MAKFIKDDIDRFHDYGVYSPSRTIYVGSEDIDLEGQESGTDAKMAEKVIKNLHILDATSNLPIVIIMSNPGGDWYHGMAIYDAIKACRSHVTVKVFGYAMSMGSIILQAADKRVMAPNARIMIHHGYMGMPSDHTKIFEKWATESKKISNEMVQIYLSKIKEKHPDFKKKKLDQMLNFDTILTAKEAVELGLADEMIEPAQGHQDKN
jgi:ATP-dependent Clp protease protease subunit